MASVTGIVGGLVLTNSPGGNPVDYRIAATGGIQSGYGTAIYENSPVKISGGYLVAAVGTASGDNTGGIVGTFMGVEYTDSNSVRQYSNWWPASTTGTNIVAYYSQNPYITYNVQANGSLAQTTLGYEVDFANVSGSTTTGICSGTVNASTAVGNGTQRLLQIVGLIPGADNAWGDAYTIVQVRIAAHQFVSAVTGIS